MSHIRFKGRVYFTHEELACKSTNVVRLSPGFALELLRLRLMFGRPMLPSSCCRSKSHNDSVGGHPRSLHVYDYPHWPTNGCCAIDILTHTSEYRDDLIKTAWKAGWSIGLGSGFLHLDRRVDYTQLPQTRFGY